MVTLLSSIEGAVLNYDGLINNYLSFVCPFVFFLPKEISV